MPERGLTVVLSMKITAQCSVKVKKIKQNKVWGVSWKANKKASIILSANPWCANTLNMLCRSDPSLIHLKSNIRELKKSSVRMTRMTRGRE